VRAGKEASVLKGARKDRLPKFSKEMVGLLAGELPDAVERGDLFRGTGIRLPKSIQVEVLRSKEGLDFRFRATLANADGAKQFANAILNVRQDGLAGLKGGRIGISPKAVAAVQKTLESIRIQSKGADVEGTASAPIEALLAVMLLAVDPSPPDL